MACDWCCCERGKVYWVLFVFFSASLIYTGIVWSLDPYTDSSVSLGSTFVEQPTTASTGFDQTNFFVTLDLRWNGIYFTAARVDRYATVFRWNGEHFTKNTNFDPMENGEVVAWGSIFASSFSSSLSSREAISTHELFNATGLAAPLNRLYVMSDGANLFNSYQLYQQGMRDLVFAWICPSGVERIRALLLIQWIGMTLRFSVNALIVAFMLFFDCILYNNVPSSVSLNVLGWVMFLESIVAIGYFVAELVMWISIKDFTTSKYCSKGTALAESAGGGVELTHHAFINASVHLAVFVAWCYVYYDLKDFVRARAMEGARRTIAHLPPPDPLVVAAATAASSAEVDQHNHPMTLRLLQDVVPEFPEFKSATSLISLTPRWIRSSRLRRYTSSLAKAASVAPFGSCEKFNQDAAVMVIVKAFRCRPQDAMAIVDPFTHTIVFAQLEAIFAQSLKAQVVTSTSLSSCGSSSPEKRRACNVALQVLADFGHADELNALLCQVIARSSKCDSAKQHGMDALILASGLIFARRRTMGKSRTAKKRPINNNNKDSSPPQQLVDNPANNYNSNDDNNNNNNNNNSNNNISNPLQVSSPVNLHPLHLIPILPFHSPENGSEQVVVHHQHHRLQQETGATAIHIDHDDGGGESAPSTPPITGASKQFSSSFEALLTSSASPPFSTAAVTQQQSQQQVLPQQEVSALASELVYSHNRLLEIVDDFLDDFKMKALSSSILEPAKFYVSLLGRHDGASLEEAVELHGINWYLILVEDGLGFGLPISAARDSPSSSSGFANFWNYFSHRASNVVWSLFSELGNFGKSLSELLSKKQGAASKATSTKHAKTASFSASLALASPTSPPKTSSKLTSLTSKDVIVPLSSSPTSGTSNDENTERFRDLLKVDGNRRKEYSMIVEKFAYFFSYPFLVRKMLETLNSEIKPEHAGFRNVCSRLFEEFQKQGLDVKLAPRSESKANNKHARGAARAPAPSPTFRPASFADRHHGDANNDVNDNNDDNDDECFDGKNKYYNNDDSNFNVNTKETTNDRNHQTYRDFDDWCFNDEYFTEMNLDRVAMFFAWLGIIRPLSRDEKTVKEMAKKMEKERNSSRNEPFPCEGSSSSNGNSGGAAADHVPRASNENDDDQEMKEKVKSDNINNNNNSNNNNNNNDDDDDVRDSNCDSPPSTKFIAWPPKGAFPILNIDSLGQAHTSSSPAEPLLTASDLQQDANQVFDNICPICLETRDDIEPLAHLAAIGDTSSHRMCGECRAKFGQSGRCPFCREAVVSEMFAAEANRFAAEVARVFRNSNSSNSNNSGVVDAQAASSLYETWELIELEHSDQKLLERICLNALKDPRCGGTIVRAAQNNAPFLRHITGVVFRFHALVADRRKGGVLDQQIDGETERSLEQAVRNIIEPFERRRRADFAAASAAESANANSMDQPPQQDFSSLTGGEWAAVMNQALAALLSAVRSGLPTTRIKQITMHLMRAMMTCFNDDSRMLVDRRGLHQHQFRLRISRYLLQAARNCLSGDVSLSEHDDFCKTFGIDLSR